MNKQEAIQILRNDIRRYSKKEFPENTESQGLKAVLRHRKEKVEAYQLAITELESQIPRKPEYDCRKHLYICPHCGEYIVTYNQNYPYDMKCGGRLEWSR